MLFRKLVIAGISGYACGKLYTQGKNNPGVAVPIVEAAVLAGVCGSVLGLGISTYRNIPNYIHTVSLGANFAITTGTFLGIRHYIVSHDDHVMPQTLPTNQKEYAASVLSGGITGTLFSLLSWKGVYPLLTNCFGGIVAGVVVQFGYNVMDEWRKQKALEMMYPELQTDNVMKRVWNKISWTNFQQSWLAFWYKQSNATAVEQDIFFLQDMIEEEKDKLNALDQQLQTSTPDHANKQQLNSVITINNQQKSENDNNASRPHPSTARQL